MQQENLVLVLDPENVTHLPKLLKVSEKTIPEILNGESGFHIYHVRMLTELMLRQLKEDGLCPLSDEEIENVAIASSLHDIGKFQIPKAILDFPGRLSPVEYDIVKKHTTLGAELIEATDFGTLDPAIKHYAHEIAYYHHERCDGTGYPKGLKNDEIPLSAEVVALADSYDALTSSRSYKDAFSQDVAIQMISSGMCGMFREQLIDCLLKVVNHSSLIGLREALYKNRAVVEKERGFTPERVLCIGNTEYLTEDFIENAFPDSKVTVVGNTELGSAERVKLFKIKKPSVQAVFDTYEFDLVVYFSSDLTYRTTEKNDAEELREVLEVAKKTGKEIKIIYLSSLDSAFKNRSDRAILCAAKENLCDYYERSCALDIKIVRIPYLYSGTYSGDYLYKLFEKLHKKRHTVIDEKPENKIHFVSLADLSSLIFRFIENWKTGSGTLTVGSDFDLTFKDFEKELISVTNCAPLDFVGENDCGSVVTNNKAIRNEYGWFAKIPLTDNLAEEYEKYLAKKQQKAQTIFEKIRQWTEKHILFVKIAELIVLFFVTEFLLHLTDSAVIFSIVDFRMAYIVIMATTHGLNFGLSAAALSSVSWLVAKIESGTNLMTIFYEPTNWLAFVFFFLIGALCGYIKLRKDDTIRFVKEENKLLEDKLVFTREIYEDTYNEKRDLKRQIIGSKDSFGKIFDITRKLNTVAPQLLYLRTMEIFEEVLENKSIAVYSINKESTFGRLEVASRDIIANAARSISTKTYAKIIENLTAGEIWRNTELKRELPMYAAGVYRGDELVLLIFLWRVDNSQRSLYYVNLFKILRDLVQMSLLRAFDYNQAIYDTIYLEDTHIMTEKAFESVLADYTALTEKKVSSYILLEIDITGHTYGQIEALLTSKIRSNDIIGIAPNGNIYVLLTQATPNDLPFIMPRLESTGLSIKVINE